MRKSLVSIGLVLVIAASAAGQTAPNTDGFELALPEHQGKLRWHADGFEIVQVSAKPGGREIGIRGRSESRQLMFLGFLFLVSNQSALAGPRCRDGAMDLMKGNPAFKILAQSELADSKNLPVELITYAARGDDGKTVYSMRGFVATGDICGDLEFYSDNAISPSDPYLKGIFESYRFDPGYTPQFADIFLYAQILFKQEMYKAAAPLFEESLTKLAGDKNDQTMRRVATDQAGMSYGISGDTSKARSIFESAIKGDPDYPMYYYNLACADAQDGRLANARTHLQEAFARKANMIPGETLPDPSKDDSFLPYRSDKEFWAFIQTLR